MTAKNNRTMAVLIDSFIIFLSKTVGDSLAIEAHGNALSPRTETDVPSVTKKRPKFSSRNIPLSSNGYFIDRFLKSRDYIEAKRLIFDLDPSENEVLESSQLVTTTTNCHLPRSANHNNHLQTLVNETVYEIFNNRRISLASYIRMHRDINS